MNIKNALIEDTTKNSAVYEVSKILKRCKNIDYYTIESEDSANITISTIGTKNTLCHLSVFPDLDDIFVSFNMRLDPVSVIDFMTLILEISSHVEKGIIIEESFVSVMIEDSLEILWDSDAHDDLGYVPLKWDVGTSFEDIGI